jgi:hypothetical protein
MINSLQKYYEEKINSLILIQKNKLILLNRRKNLRINSQENLGNRLKIWVNLFIFPKNLLIMTYIVFITHYTYQGELIKPFQIFLLLNNSKSCSNHCLTFQFFFKNTILILTTGTRVSKIIASTLCATTFFGHKISP